MIALYRPASGVHGIGWQAALLWLAWRQFESNRSCFLSKKSHILKRCSAMGQATSAEKNSAIGSYILKCSALSLLRSVEKIQPWDPSSMTTHGSLSSLSLSSFRFFWSNIEGTTNDGRTLSSLSLLCFGFF
jgi:hypothetical protein